MLCPQAWRCGWEGHFHWVGDSIGSCHLEEPVEVKDLDLEMENYQTLGLPFQPPGQSSLSLPTSERSWLVYSSAPPPLQAPMSLVQAHPFHSSLGHQALLFLTRAAWNSLLPDCCRLCSVVTWPLFKSRCLSSP